MSNFNKLLIIGILATGVQASARVSDHKVELEAIVRFTHNLEQQKESVEATKLAQWLQKNIITSNYCPSKTIIVIATIINSDYSMDKKIAHLLNIKNQQEATDKEKRLSYIQEGAALLCMVIALPIVMIPSITIIEDLSKKLLIKLNKPATVAKKTKFTFPGLLR